MGCVQSAGEWEVVKQCFCQTLFPTNTKIITDKELEFSTSLRRSTIERFRFLYDTDRNRNKHYWSFPILKARYRIVACSEHTLVTQGPDPPGTIDLVLQISGDDGQLSFNLYSSLPNRFDRWQHHNGGFDGGVHTRVRISADNRLLSLNHLSLSLPSELTQLVADYLRFEIEFGTRFPFNSFDPDLLDGQPMQITTELTIQGLEQCSCRIVAVPPHEPHTTHDLACISANLDQNHYLRFMQS